MSYYNSQYIPTDIIVVESDGMDPNYDPYMGLTAGDFIIYLAIGLAYVILMSLVVDQLLGVELVDKACSFDSIGQTAGQTVEKSTDKFLAKYGTCKAVSNTFDSKKFVYMIVIGAISIFAGGYLAKSDPKYLTGGMGIALGGFWAIIYYTAYNWHSINRYIQLVIVGLLFAALVMGSIRM